MPNIHNSKYFQIFKHKVITKVFKTICILYSMKLEKEFRKKEIGITTKFALEIVTPIFDTRIEL